MRIVTWFHADSSTAPGQYAQVSGSAASKAHYEVYLRCVDLCMASCRRWNPQAELVVVLNPAADGLLSAERRARWRHLRVDVRVVTNHHDDRLWSAWQNQFYLLDVMAAALQDAERAETVVILDSDCVVTRDLEMLDRRVRSAGRDDLEIPYPDDHVTNGLSRRELQVLGESYTGGSIPFVPAYLGGEYVAMTGAAMSSTLTEAEEFYRWNIRRRREGLSHVHEEAQLLSLVQRRPSGSQSGSFIARIWTKPWAGRTVPIDAGSLAIWHLPGEKTSGIRRLRSTAMSETSWFWTADHDSWVQRASRVLGTSPYTLKKLVQDLVLLAPRIPSSLVRRVTRLRRRRRSV